MAASISSRVPRRDPVTENGMQIAPAGPMGVATAINFQPTGGGKAAITGDFVLVGDEVNPVIKALRANGIEVTAIHSHMLTEQPRLFFMHFWANDDALKLAKGCARRSTRPRAPRAELERRRAAMQRPGVEVLKDGTTCECFAYRAGRPRKRDGLNEHHQETNGRTDRASGCRHDGTGRGFGVGRHSPKRNCKSSPLAKSAPGSQAWS